MTAKDLRPQQSVLGEFEARFFALSRTAKKMMPAAIEADAKMPKGNAVQHVENIYSMLNDMNDQLRTTHEALEAVADAEDFTTVKTGGDDKENLWGILPKALLTS